MSRVLTMTEVVRRLGVKYPDVLITGGERHDGFWIRCVCSHGRWQFDRLHFVSTGAAYSFAEVALAEFHGA